MCPVKLSPIVLENCATVLLYFISSELLALWRATELSPKWYPSSWSVARKWSAFISPLAVISVKCKSPLALISPPTVKVFGGADALVGNPIPTLPLPIPYVEHKFKCAVPDPWGDIYE